MHNYLSLSAEEGSKMQKRQQKPVTASDLLQTPAWSLPSGEKRHQTQKPEQEASRDAVWTASPMILAPARLWGWQGSSIVSSISNSFNSTPDNSFIFLLQQSSAECPLLLTLVTILPWLAQECFFRCLYFICRQCKGNENILQEFHCLSECVVTDGKILFWVFLYWQHRWFWGSLLEWLKILKSALNTAHLQSPDWYLIQGHPS